MSKKSGFLFILVIFFVSVIFSNQLAFAEELVPDVETVFPKEEVNQLAADLDKKTNYLLDINVNEDRTLGDCQSFYKGAILVTSDSYKGLIPTGHAAIMYSKYKVVESLIDGVQFGDNDWCSTKSLYYAARVKSITAKKEAAVAEWCKSQIGKPYNFVYSNKKRSDKFYCSQLVWSGYFVKTGIDLDTQKFGFAVHPLELINNGKVIIYHKGGKSLRSN